MPRPLKNRSQALLMTLADVLSLCGLSDRKWRELAAAQEIAQRRGQRVDAPLPRPVDLAGRPMYRRRDVEAWVESLELRGD